MIKDQRAGGERKIRLPKKKKHTTAQDGFTFSIISGTTNGTTAVTDYSTLPEGIWSGDVSVQFDATWTS